MSPSDDPPDAADQDPLSPEEREALVLRWYQGRMFRFVSSLLAFVERRRDEILLVADGSLEHPALISATKSVLRAYGSLDFRGEMKDQSRRIDEHLWYAGQRGDHDRPRLSGEWTEAYAKKWRRWRIEKYLFCVDKCAAEIIAILLRPHADGDRRQGG